MNRTLTNTIRFIIDEFLPPIIRDNKFFMYPLFYYWFKGKDIETAMEFKKKVLKFSEEDFINYYKHLDCRAKDRSSDLNENSINYIISQINILSENIIDIGCGNGYLIKKIEGSFKKFGCDVFDETPKNLGAEYIQGDILSLPFDDDSYDIVICTHTLEHIPRVDLAIKELKRIAKKQLIIALPKQKYYYYTLDLHLHFFPDRFSIINTINMSNYNLVEIDGDWVYVGNK